MSPVKLLLPLLGPLLWVIPAHAGEINGSVEIPLDDLLQMRTDEPPPTPAVVATVDALTMEGRLLGDAIEIDAQVTVTVLTKDRWVEVPFLDLGPSATLSRHRRLAPVLPGSGPEVAWAELPGSDPCVSCF